MAGDESDLNLALRQVDELTEAFLAELGCDTARFTLLCVEFMAAVDDAEPLVLKEGERLARQMPPDMAAYRDSARRYKPEREGFLSVISLRRSRLGLDD